ncbi:MAG: HAMP domain-containing histidine kinase [Clostridia bacterium]|nr:HAMP domain-containing histidine kinase [Clostridia bacterium]
MKRQARKNGISLLLIFTLLVFTVLLAALGIAALAVGLMIRAGVISSYSDLSSSYSAILVYMFLISLIAGTALAFALSNIPLKPVNRIIRAMNRLAGGDFNVRLRIKKPFSNLSAVVELADSFNKMAEELEHTEMLRSDFINNFSHEFKTPIVSIAGFAKLLRHGKLTQEEKEQYIGVIEEESLRLADMATNMLSLSKVENQSLLSDVKTYNLSEQLRGCVLLLESKWEKKQLELEVEFDEYEIEACEELLKQAWINLIDNAVKFSPEKGKMSIVISESDGTITVKISNTGSSIAPENLKKVFGKFYQEDESHASKGNGIGLAVVQKVVSLHGGSVEALSGGNVTSFVVTLPKYRKTRAK